MNLTDHFTIAELSVTNSGLKNAPPPVVIERLRVLCVEVLEPVRAHFGRPVRVNSAYRSTAVNRKVGGVDTSQHCQGFAADIEIDGIANGDLATWIRDNLAFDQLILENYRRGEPNSGWVHVSYRGDGRNRRSVLTYTGGKYLNGLAL